VLGGLDGLTRGIVAGRQTLRHRRAISSSDHCSAMSGRLRSTISSGLMYRADATLVNNIVSSVPKRGILFLPRSVGV
jgi:hypothetical protein